MINYEKSFLVMCKFLLFLFFSLIIVFIGVANVCADEVIDTSTWLDRTGRGWSDNVLDYSSNKVYNDYWFKNNYDLVGGVYTPPNTFDYVTLQYFEHDGLYNPCNNDSYKLDFRLHYSNSNFLQYIKSFYINETACTITGTDTINGNVSISCVYTPVNSNKVTLAVNYKDFSSNSTSEVYISRNINTTCSLSSGAIIQNQNENTQNIINNNNSNTESINSNNDTNTQNIINNNNQNTQSINNNINNNLKTCRDSNNLFNVAQATSKNYNASLSLENTNYYIYHPNQDNITITATAVHYMDPISLPAGTYNFNFKVNSTGANFKRMRYQIRYGPKGSASNLTDIATEVITWDNSLEIFGRSFTFTLPSSTYLWISITNDVPGGTLTIYDYMLSRGSKRLDYEKYGEPYCINKIDNVTDSVNNLGDRIDSTNDKIDSTNQKLDDLQDSIMDNSNPNVPSVETMVGWLPPGPVDSILNLPLTFLNTLNTNLGKTCSPVSIPLPFVNQSFNLPCFSEYMTTYLPSFNTLWSLIGGIVCVYILYNYLLSLYVWVDKTLTLRENTLPGYYDDNWGGGA